MDEFLGAICGVSRGGYTKPMSVKKTTIKWEDEECNPISPPQKHPCEHEKHWEWGRGTRNGQKLYFPINEMFFQNWHLTDEEMNEAIANYDMFSLEMRGRIICKECAEKENSRN